VSLPSVIVLNAQQLRRILDPESFRSDVFTTWWLLCRNAAWAAMMVCCNLSGDELGSLRRRDWLPDGNETVRGRGGRTIPLIAAARFIVTRYLEAMPIHLQDSEFLFVKRDGRPICVRGMPMSIEKAGRRLGLCSDLPGSLRATFRAAVLQDPTGDDAARVLLPTPRLTARLAGGGGIGIGRLRRLLEDYHPLAPFGRIRFFETKKELPPLLREMLSCTEARRLEPEEIKALRRTTLPEAAKYWADGLVTYGQVAKWFGIETVQMISWMRLYKVRGAASLLGHKTWNMDPASRAAVLAAIADGAPYISIAGFHEHLRSHCGFRYHRSTLSDFLVRSGFELPKRESFTATFREAIRTEREAPDAPASFAAFHERLKRKYGFDFTYGALHLYLVKTGWRPARDAASWRELLAREARRRKPRSVLSFRKLMFAEFGFPFCDETAGKYLRCEGIVLFPNSQRRGLDDSRASAAARNDLSAS
jgi:transposase